MGLCAAVAEERGLAPTLVEDVVKAVMRVTCDNVKNDGWCKLGGGLKLTLKLEQHRDDAIAATGTWNLREYE